TSISADTSAVSPRISSLPERIFPSKRPSMRKVSSKVSSPEKWLPRSMKPFKVEPSALPFIPLLRTEVVGRGSQVGPTSFHLRPLSSTLRLPRQTFIEPNELFFGPEGYLDSAAPPSADDPDAGGEPARELLFGVACERVAPVLATELGLRGQRGH